MDGVAERSTRRRSSSEEVTRSSPSVRAPTLKPEYSAAQTIDAKGKLILPGFINGHTHVPMTLFRGLHDDVTLNDWLYKYIFPAEKKNVN